MSKLGETRFPTPHLSASASTPVENGFVKQWFMKRKSVWLVEEYFRNDETPVLTAWSTRDLAVRDAEAQLEGDTGVKKQLEHNSLCSWRSDSRQVFVSELMISDTFGFAPRAPRKLARDQA